MRDREEPVQPGPRERFEATLYERPLRKLSPRETAFAFALADLGPGPHRIGDVAKALGTQTREISSIRMTLTRKAMVSAPMPGIIEFRIPFTDRYLRDHRDDFETDDVIAYRKNLRPHAGPR